MRKLLALAAALLLFPAAASAQVYSSNQTGAIGTVVSAVDTSGNTIKAILPSVSAGGPVASGGTAAGNPTPIGCDYNATPPTVTTGQRVTVQCDQNGNVNSVVVGNSVTDSDARANTTILGWAPNKASSSHLGVHGATFNGTTWDRLRSIQGADGTGLGVAAYAVAPTSSANGAIAPIVSTVAESAHILKASAGNLYRASVTAGASAGFLMVFNATTAPADGAVTPLVCRPVAANGQVEANFAGLPARFSTGITAVFSTTGCFTKTASATASFEGYVQ
jgi:hypothetical protein